MSDKKKLKVKEYKLENGKLDLSEVKRPLIEERVKLTDFKWKNIIITRKNNKETE